MIFVRSNFLRRATMLSMYAAVSGVVLIADCDGSELRDLLALSPPSTASLIEGNSSTGNRYTAFSGYTNTSQQTIVLNGVKAAVIVDPGELGFADLDTLNVDAALAALEAVHPDFDLFNARFWVPNDPPTKNWVALELDFSVNPFPITLRPGETFQYTSTGFNSTLGPDFGPLPATNVPNARVNAIGEHVTAIDFDYSSIPEPRTISIGLVGIVGMLGMRLRGGRAAASRPMGVSEEGPSVAS